MERELTIVGDVHPEFLEDGTFKRVEHPATLPLTHGAPDLGWDGDYRLAVYEHLQTKRLAVYRREGDEQYHRFCMLKEGRALSPESVNQVIRRLIDTDTRRGWNPSDEIERLQSAYRKQQYQQRMDFVGDFADKLHWGLARSHLPGVWISRVRNALPRR